MADRFGFALLLPEQRRANNPNGCFTWFSAEDTSRECGEALSIRQMIERMVIDHGIDRSRIYVTGLSAGGAMTSVMLATYPEVFAGGAIVAGLPYGSAANVQEAFDTHVPGPGPPRRRVGRFGSRCFSPFVAHGQRCRSGTAVLTPPSSLGKCRRDPEAVG